MLRSTTILAMRHRSGVAVGGDGQVTLGQVVMKSDAHKVRRLHNGKVLAGFAGAAADAFSLLEALRGQAQGLPGQRAARRHGIGQGLAHGPNVAAAGGDASGGRP